MYYHMKFLLTDRSVFLYIMLCFRFVLLQDSHLGDLTMLQDSNIPVQLQSKHIVQFYFIYITYFRRK